MLCFLKSMRDSPHKTFHYKNLRDDIINWECMKYPCSRKDIDRFEELNSGLIFVNVFRNSLMKKKELSQIELQK